MDYFYLPLYAYTWNMLVYFINSAISLTKTLGRSENCIEISNLVSTSVEKKAGILEISSLSRFVKWGNLLPRGNRRQSSS